MRTIIVLSRQYYDGSGYAVMKAYTKARQADADNDLNMLQHLNDDFNYRLTEIPICE